MKGWIRGDIEPLMSEWLRLKGHWQASPGKADWQGLRALARQAALTRGRETGEAMPRRAFGGAPDVFDEKFLEYLIEAGFDPFETRGERSAAALDHAALLAASERGNESARRMRALCDRAARLKFSPLFGARARRVSSAELSGLRKSWERFNAVLPQDVRARGLAGAWPAGADRRQRALAPGRLAAARGQAPGPAPSER